MAIASAIGGLPHKRIALGVQTIFFRRRWDRHYDLLNGTAAAFTTSSRLRARGS
jgi:hypothetical protein